MEKLRRPISTASRLLTFVFLIASGTVFLLGPTRWAATHLGPFAAKYTPFFVFATLAGAAISVALAWLFGKDDVTPFKKTPRYGERSRLVAQVKIALSVLIFLRATIGLMAPLDIDENCHAFAAATGVGDVYLNPFRTNIVGHELSSHPVSQAATLLSLKVFGITKFGFRAPALLFTALLLLVFFYFSEQFLSPFATLLVLANLLFNQLAIWYLHSQRGYVSMMLFSLLALWIVLRFLSEDDSIDFKRGALFLLVLIVNSFTLTFGAIFSGLLLISLLGWSYFQKSVDKEKVRSLLLWGSGTIPLIAALLVCNMIFLSRLGDLNEGGVPEDLLPNLARTFGLSLVWWGKAALLLIGIALLSQIRTLTKPDFLSTFVGFSTIFFLALVTLLEVRVFLSRYLLAFLIPAVALMGELLRRMSFRRLKQGVMIAGLALLTLGPWVDGKGIYNYLSLPFQDYEKFLGQVKAETAPLNRHCYTFSGKEDLAGFAREFHLAEARHVDEKTCARRFHIVVRQEKPFTDVIATPKLTDAKELIRYGNELILYETGVKPSLASR